MNPSEFISEYLECFGSGAPLPLAVIYTDKPLGEPRNIKGCMFKQFVTPDVLSGLFAWANYDTSDLNTVMSPWGSGCASSITTMVNENREGGKHCFIGMLDVSARQYFRPDILSFSIPQSRLLEMCGTLRQSCISGSPAWLKVKKRINYKSSKRTIS